MYEADYLVFHSGLPLTSVPHQSITFYVSCQSWMIRYFTFMLNMVAKITFILTVMHGTFIKNWEDYFQCLSHFVLSIMVFAGLGYHSPLGKLRGFLSP